MADLQSLPLSKVGDELWKLDENRAKDIHVKINLQNRTSSRDNVDRADEKFFKHVDENIFERPTFKSFKALLDNYQKRTGVPEEVTDAEKRENNNFIDAIMETKVMKWAHKYLVSKEKVSDDEAKFKELLYDIWFKLYSRTQGSQDLDSSAFEHVFIGEVKPSGKVSGFHNWIQLYHQEKNNELDYHGYIDVDGFLVVIRFEWNTQFVKPISSIFLGVSPEFEVALYTILYLMAADEETDMVINGKPVCMVLRGEGRLETCYPVIPD